jgi:hypothetical protein
VDSVEETDGHRGRTVGEWERLDAANDFHARGQGTRPIPGLREQIEERSRSFRT